MRLGMVDANFNSIKVQLKPVFRFNDYVFVRFQFHKGTIKTKCGHSPVSELEISIP